MSRRHTLWWKYVESICKYVLASYLQIRFTTPRRSNSRKVCFSVAILSLLWRLLKTTCSPQELSLTNSKAPSPVLEFVFLSGFSRDYLKILNPKYYTGCATAFKNNVTVRPFQQVSFCGVCYIVPVATFGDLTKRVLK